MTGLHSPPSPFSATLIVEDSAPLEFGGVLERRVIGFRQYGDPRLPLVIVLGGISAGRHITGCGVGSRPGWWDRMVGDGRPIDTTRYSVLGIDWLGGTGASTGPKCTNGGTGGNDGCFPSIGTRDQARAIVAVLDQLGVARAHAIVGASYGGMVALSCSVHFPERIARSVVISAAHRTHPMATALRSLQRDVVRLGVETGRVADSLRIARGIAMTTYRTTDEFRERFEAEARWLPEGARFPVQDYLDHSGRRFAESFSAASFLSLSESIDLHRIDPAAVRTPTTLVAVSSDTLVPCWQMEELRDALRIEPSWHVVDSIYGHDAFLKEACAMSRIITGALTNQERR